MTFDQHVSRMTRDPDYLLEVKQDLADALAIARLTDHPAADDMASILRYVQSLEVVVEARLATKH